MTEEQAMNRDPNRKFWNPEAETMPREELYELKLKRMKKQIKYDYENSIFYKEQFDRAGIKPRDIRTFEDFTHIPTMDKDDQRRCQEESIERFGHPYGILACAPVEKIVRLSSTSGTTGMPTLYTLTKNDVQLVREFHARKLWRWGIRPGDVVMNTFSLSMFTGGVPIVDGIQEYGACVVPVGSEGGVARVLQYWELCKANYLTCTPGFAEHIMDRCHEILGKPASELGLKGLMCAGEPGSAIPEVRKRIMEGFNLEWFSDFIGGAHNFHGYCCDADQIEITRGMHLASEDYCILELLDLETKQPLKLRDGTVGEMCFTFLEWEGTPLLRYLLGDVLQVFTSLCDCGDTRLRFRVIGRADDMLIIKGVNLYPAALKNFVAGFIPRVTGEFRILLDTPGPRIKPPLRVQIEYGEGLSREDLPNLEKEMMSIAHQVLRVSPRIEFVPPNTLERAIHKRKYIVKLYEKEGS